MRVTSYDILEGPLNPTLYRMIMPMIVGISVMMAFGAVDTFFVSRIGAQELAAISFTLPVTMIIFNLILGLGIGASVLVGSAIGKGEMGKAARITTDSLLFSILAVAGISILGYFTIDPLFMMMGATELTLPHIHDYMDIWYLFVGLMIIPMTGNSVIRATGDTKWPSILMMASGLVNAVLDPIFIFGLGPIPAMGIKGAVTATVISWFVGFIGGIYLLYFRDKLILLTIPKVKELLHFWGKIIKIGVPISLANVMMPLAGVAITRFVSEYGEIAVAGLGAGARLETFATIIPFAITAGLSPFMAQNIGAGNFQRAHQSLLVCVKFIMIYQFAIFAVFGGGAYWLAYIFSSVPEVTKVTRYYLWIMPLGIGFYSILIVLNTAFNAAHRSDLTLLSSAIRILVFYIPCAWIGGEYFGLPGIFAGATLGNIIATAVCWGIYQKTRDKLPTTAPKRRSLEDDIAAETPPSDII